MDNTNDPGEVYEKVLLGLCSLLTELYTQYSNKSKSFTSTDKIMRVLAAMIFYEYLRRDGNSPSKRDDFILKMAGSGSSNIREDVSSAYSSLKRIVISMKLLSYDDEISLNNSPARDVSALLCKVLYKLHKLNVGQNFAGVIINKPKIKPFLQNLEFLNQSIIPALVGFHIDLN